MIDFDQQLERCLEIVRREINHLMLKSAEGKLAPTEARDLCSYTKLLAELDRDAKGALEGLSPEDLEKLAQGP